MSSSDTPYDMEHIAGDGEYAIEVVSGSRHQDRLEWLAQGRGEEPKEYACTAVLTHEPDNPFDPNAVSVSILGVRVGFLSRDAAASFVGAMDTWDFEQASCDAIIEGGWYRNAEDKGDFCVMLDANPDFVPAEFPPADDSLLEAVALPATTASARSGYAIRSMGLGAIATMAMLAVVGAVLWMMPQQRANYSPAAASRVQAPEPALLASADTRRREGPAAAFRPVNDERQADTATATPAEAREQRNPEPAVVTSTRSVSVATTSTAAQSARPAPSVAQRATIARTLAPQEPATVAPPIVSTVAGEGPTHETAAADTAGTQLAETPAGVDAVGERSIEALPAPVAPEVQTVSDRKTVIAATSVADEIDPPITTASSPPAPPSPLPRPDPPEAAGDDSPPPTAVTRAAQPERKARSRYQRARFNRRSRSARSSTRSRSAVRSSRSERRAPREEVASASAPERPPSAGIKLPNTPAARMLQGWTNELTSASSQLKRSRQ